MVGGGHRGEVGEFNEMKENIVHRRKCMEMIKILSLRANQICPKGKRDRGGSRNYNFIIDERVLRVCAQ